MRNDYATQNADVALVLSVHPGFEPVIEQLQEVLAEDEFSRYMRCWAANVVEYADTGHAAARLTLTLAQQTAGLRFRDTFQSRARTRRARTLLLD